MDSPSLLNDADRCLRLAHLSQRWQPPAIHPTEALYQAIERGLMDDSGDDPGEVASEHLMELATGRGLDSNQEDLLGQAEHLGGIASFVTWILRTGEAWKRPEPIKLPNGTIWTPSAFLSADESHLRRVVLCGRWDAYRMVQEEHDWRTLESAIYGVPMDLIVIVLGQERSGRRHGPLTKGWQHPVSKTLRFRKRDGEGFDGAWNAIYREQSNFSREDWLDAMVEDGVLSESVLIHQAGLSETFPDVKTIAENALDRIGGTEYAPQPQLSRCFDRFHPCPFRSACPQGKEPSEDLGFTKLLVLHGHDSRGR